MKTAFFLTRENIKKIIEDHMGWEPEDVQAFCMMADGICPTPHRSDRVTNAVTALVETLPDFPDMTEEEYLEELTPREKAIHLVLRELDRMETMLFTLANDAKSYLITRPPFTSKPVGAEGSPARAEQTDQIAAAEALEHSIELAGVLVKGGRG